VLENAKCILFLCESARKGVERKREKEGEREEGGRGKEGGRERGGRQRRRAKEKERVRAYSIKKRTHTHKTAKMHTVNVME
jgi:hypothetical protein